jgi:MerR family redox-sensitive transcriptional activator SoxR
MSRSSETLSIGEVAQKAGVRPSALRYYESVGVLPAPKRQSGQRRYDAGILKQIRFIQSAQKAGLSIAEMKTLLDSPETERPYSERLQELACRKLVEVEKLIADAQAMKQVLEAGLACRCARLEDCLLFIKEEE